VEPRRANKGRSEHKNQRKTIKQSVSFSFSFAVNINRNRNRNRKGRLQGRTRSLSPDLEELARSLPPDLESPSKHRYTKTKHETLLRRAKAARGTRQRARAGTQVAFRSRETDESGMKRKNPKRKKRNREKVEKMERKKHAHIRIDQHAQVRDGVGVVEAREEAGGSCQCSC
jgi:hypothetical protein